MSLRLLVLSLIGAIWPLFLFLHPAQSMAVAQTQICLSLAAAIEAQDAKVVLCGFPQIGADPERVPFGCHRRVTGLKELLLKEPGLQDLTADKICYLKYSEVDSGMVALNLDPVANEYKTATVQVHLLRSVSALVGISPTLQISGRNLIAINPDVFLDIGPAQKERLKHLSLTGTGIASIDLSLLAPLAISDLLLISNPRLDRITNPQGAKLPTLTDLVIWNANQSLLNCRNSLPEALTTVYLLQESLSGNCLMCNLPKLVTKVIVKSAVTSLPNFPTAVGTDEMMPFPLTKSYHYLDQIPGVEPSKEFAINVSPSGCQTTCNCEPWVKKLESRVQGVNPTSRTTGATTSTSTSAVSSTGTSTSTSKDQVQQTRGESEAKQQPERKELSSSSGVGSGSAQSSEGGGGVGSRVSASGACILLAVAMATVLAQVSPV